jgi:hypothetical protein
MRYVHLTISALSLLFFLSHCKDANSTANLAESVEEPTLEAEQPILELLDPSRTGIDFANTIVETYENNITTNINMYNGGGLCIADINNDQLPDIYFVSSNGKNKMYLNQGNLQFKDITDESGLASEEGFETAVTAADVNADGFLDFYICRGGTLKDDSRRNRLFINNQNNTFSEKAAEFGIDDMSASTGANFFDYDLDGDLDLYVLNYPTEAIWTNKIEAVLGPDKKYKPLLMPRLEFDSDRFYENVNGKFVDASKKTGIQNLAYGLSVSISDFNRDGWPDVYVGNDFIQPDLLYINNKKGGFTDQLSQYFQHSSQHTMGTDITDFDNDGLVDLYAVDMLSAHNQRQKAFLATNTLSKYTALIKNGYFEPVVQNVLQRNNGNNTFSDVACINGVYKTDWSWSGLFFDIDNDGLRDLHVTNGYRREVTSRDFADFILPEIQKTHGTGRRLRDIYPNFDDFLKLVPTFKVRNFCYQNKGNLQFDDSSGKWMTIPASWSCGSVWADLDKDGDLELVVNNLEQPAYIYENKSVGKTGNNYLQLKLVGGDKNPFAVGASCLLEYEGSKIQYAEQFPTRGIFSSVEHLLHFGLGKTSAIDRLTVRFPNGKTLTMENVQVNQRLVLRQTDAQGGPVASICPDPASTKPLFTKNKALNFQHTENEFNDFETWPLNAWSCSDLGPFTAKGDVNGDGLEDLFIGNAFDQPATLAIQQENGQFKPLQSPSFTADKLFEDHGACFFDADADGDLDLVVLSGGAEATSPQAWQHRLYINADGKGDFRKTPPTVLPPLPDIGGRVVAHDYDSDGDLDLFIGGRVKPANWPLPPASAVLRNDQDRFTDVTAQVAPDFKFCGMITDLVWANIDADPSPELIVCGEWMPINVFKLQNGQLVKQKDYPGLQKSNGLWNRLICDDLDGDGDLDLVTGNLGFNTKYTASSEAPLQCYAGDFDGNGTLDPLMAIPENGEWHPMVQKEVLTKHIPSLKKKFLYAKDYGKATITDVYNREILDKALNLNCYTLATSWWENKNGTFIQHELPRLAQIAPTMGIVVEDVNGDGRKDILIAGNKYGMEVETNRCDAGTGLVLIGTPANQFIPLEGNKSGFWANREVRDLLLLRGKNRRTILVANNDTAAETYWLQ